MLDEKITEIILRIKNNAKPILVTSHNDTDGITSAAIMSRALQRLKKSFTLRIIKNLDKAYIESLPDDHLLLFLDLASNSLDYLKEKNTEVIILDHHEITKVIPPNVTMINPMAEEEENMCSAGICYRFALALNEQNKDLATLAVIGMVGDMHETHVNKGYSKILNDAEVTVRKGLLLYPATRPLDRVLEGSFSMYIPGVTGSFGGTMQLLRDTNIEKTPRGFKSLAELTEEEMRRLTTAILLRKVGSGDEKIEKLIGNMYLVKFLHQLEDARELSALINACSRMDQPGISLGFCLGNKTIRKEADKIYTTYRKTISAALGEFETMESIIGSKYIITHAKDRIKDTIVGTVTSIRSFSPLYEEGTILITMAYTPEEKIKVSARIAGRKGRNVREILEKAVADYEECEVGGHHHAAGCLLQKRDEASFLDKLKQTLDIELVRV